MNRAFLTMTTVCFLALTLPTFGVQCDMYYDSQAAQDEYGDSLCWLSGAICYECYSVNSGDSCSANWEECDPFPFDRDHKRIARLDVTDPQNGSVVQYCRTAVSSAPLPSARELL